MFEIIKDWPMWGQFLIVIPFLIGLGIIWRYRHIIIPASIALGIAIVAFIFRKKK